MRDLREISQWAQTSEGRKTLAKAAEDLLRIFLRDWFRWEVFGWTLALSMGFTPEDLENYPELGWFAKAVSALSLLSSEDKKERLLGGAILHLTEIPPEEIMVEVGGELIPAVVHHYRMSAQTPHILDEVIEVSRQLEGQD